MKDGKENIVVFWNAQNLSCMAERKGTCTALENRDVACTTATDKIPDQKGNKLNSDNAGISCSSTHHNIAILYYAIPKSTMWNEYKNFKYKQVQVRKYQKYFCLYLPHVCTALIKAQSTRACTTRRDANPNNGSGLQGIALTNCSAVTHMLKKALFPPP